MAVWSNFAGTVLGYFRLGLSGVRLKNSSGVLAVRDAADAADAKIQIADGTAANHGVSKAQIESGYQPFMQDYIAGLVPSWVSANAINVSAGAAYIQSLGYVYVSASTISLTSIATAATTWYYLYLYNNSGTPAVEVSTTAPADPYYGTARSKTGDTSRRFIAAVKTAAANTLIPFQQVGPRWTWRTESGLSLRALSAGTATTATTVGLSSGVPVTTRMAFLRLFNLATAGSGISMYFSSADEALDTSTIYYGAVDPQSQAYIDFPVDASQQIKYINSAVGGSSFVDIYGFTVQR